MYFNLFFFDVYPFQESSSGMTKDHVSFFIEVNVSSLGEDWKYLSLSVDTRLLSTERVDENRKID